MINKQNILQQSFFNRDACKVAQSLLGKIIRKKFGANWLSAQIIETEAYYINEKGSHASLGFTEKRKALFMPPGTIYMYYARGKDSLNMSCMGEGNAVLIKSGIPYRDNMTPGNMIKIMQSNNPTNSDLSPRSRIRLCSGQTLLCRSLGITVKEWNQKQFDSNQFFVEDIGILPSKIINTKRLGIAAGRDEHLFYRFIDFDYVIYCTKNPLTIRKNQSGIDYLIKKTSMLKTT
ncbi:MAG: DNA-3-methyladenine glycosylase [Candidatus Neomarinimicrobiota bacterium]